MRRFCEVHSQAALDVTEAQKDGVCQPSPCNVDTLATTALARVLVILRIGLRWTGGRTDGLW